VSHRKRDFQGRERKTAYIRKTLIKGTTKNRIHLRRRFIVKRRGMYSRE